MNRYIWSAVGVVVLAYALMGLVKELLPMLLVVMVLYGLYSLVFKKHW